MVSNCCFDQLIGSLERYFYVTHTYNLVDKYVQEWQVRSATP